MKNLKIFLLALSLFFIYSCDNAEPEVLIEAETENISVEARTFCSGVIMSGITLNQALDNFANNLNSSIPTSNSTSMWDDWRTLLCVIDAENGPASFPNCAADFPSACERIGVSGPGVGLPCPDFIDMAYCRTRCYVRDYVTNPTDVGLTNIKVAFCDYLLAINNCLRGVPNFKPIDLDRYCGL